MQWEAGRIFYCYFYKNQWGSYWDTSLKKKKINKWKITDRDESID